MSHKVHKILPSLVLCPLHVLGKLQTAQKRSALDHIELTYHDVTVFAIPEFKSLEMLKKLFFMISLYINSNTSHNQILIVTVKKKLRKKNFDLKSIK